jgi:dipeptidase
MCDTCGIGPELTGSGISIFGKNSDREADETQLVLSVPSKTILQKKICNAPTLPFPRQARLSPRSCPNLSGCGAPRWA